ncbi:ATP-binding protein [Clostridium nigeriense]|uniref:sensor histidine kinase n=1 Tax=Clostridium nigeriense TaxID=1805470 RepID=UPI003D35529E
MFNSLKKKFKKLYIFLVLIIVFIGVVSTLNAERLRISIDGMISNSYKSINSTNGMIDAINNQNRAILIYLQGNKEEAIDIFHSNDDEFYKWLYIEKSNITEQGEEELVDKVNIEYIQFSKLFSSLQDYSNGQNHDELVNFYQEKISPQVLVVIENLKTLSKLNENSMYINQDLIKTRIGESIYFIFSISLIGAIVCAVISIVLTNRFFKPINLLVDSIKDPILFLDKNNKIKFINDDGKKLLGIENINYENKNFLDVLNLPEVYNFIKDPIKNEGLNKIIELNFNNKRYYFNLTISVFKGKDNEVEGIVLILKDITNLKELEVVKKNFVGTISHELKTPLTSIMMGIGLINNKSIGKLNDKQQNIVDTIEEDVQNLNDLVSNLLKISEIQANKDNFNIKNNDINKIMEEVLMNFEHQAKEKHISLELNLKEKLPYIMIDKEKIKWVLNNLISNAIRYTDSGMVKLDGSFDEEKIYISVTDTGRGIPKEYLKKVFERFVRVEEFEIPEESTGLGLAIAKEIVEIHGGKIWCESKVGVGSKFIFTIPLYLNKL